MGLGEGVGLLEDHADLGPDLGGVHVVGVYVLIVIEDLAIDMGAGYQLVHPVEASKQGALPTAGGADERGDLVLFDAHCHVLDCPK